MFVAVGELLTDVPRQSVVQRSDERIQRWLAEHRVPWMNMATFIGSELADTIVKISVTVPSWPTMLAVLAAVAGAADGRTRAGARGIGGHHHHVDRRTAVAHVPLETLLVDSSFPLAMLLVRSR